MTSCISSYCCAIIILLLGSHTSANVTYGNKLYAGSSCTTEHGRPGICKKLMECPSKLADDRPGTGMRDTGGRCGFDGDIEIVCCAPNLQEKLGRRHADEACKKMEENMFAADPVRDGCKGCVMGGGSGAIESEFPFMAALGYVNGDGSEPDSISYYCGGSLISLEYILTAAHCLCNLYNDVPRWVKLGSDDTRSKDAQMIPIERMIPHPQYHRRRSYHDIGIVKLQRPVRLSRQTYPICLQTTALGNPSVHPNASFIAIGATRPARDYKSIKWINSPNLNLVPVPLCNKSYSWPTTLPRGIDAAMICAADANWATLSRADQRMSGDPLLMITGHARTLLGIMSFGLGWGTGDPTVYSTPFSHIDWIESTVWPVRTQSNEISPRNAE